MPGILQDLLQPKEEEGFTTMRAPLADVVEEDIYPFFRPAADFIRSALSADTGSILGSLLSRLEICSAEDLLRL